MDRHSSLTAGEVLLTNKRITGIKQTQADSQECVHGKV